MKKKFKIVKSKLFKKQEKELPKKSKKVLGNVLKELSKNPKHALNSMSLFGKPNAMELKQWASEVPKWKIDLILEYLHHKKCLNRNGEKLAYDFWITYIKSTDKDSPKGAKA